MKFVVTGGAGFIGSHIAKFLVKSGHKVSIIDNLYRGKKLNFQEIEAKIDFHQTDILDFDQIRNIVKDSDGVFHQGALTSVPESFLQKEKYFDVNVNGTENIFKLAKEYDFKVVYASSSSVYGNTKTVPITEDFERNPINPYGITKLEDELLAEKYWNLGVKIIGLRYFNVFGPGQTPDYAGVITKFIENLSQNKPPVIFGDGSQFRDFISIDDVVAANLASMENYADKNFINIGTGISTSIKELAYLMIRLSGKSFEPIYDKLPEGDVKTSLADISLSEKLLSWKPKLSLEDGLRKYFFS
jgi:UDP-glucose 4-epimerase